MKAKLPVAELKSVAELKWVVMVLMASCWFQSSFQLSSAFGAVDGAHFWFSTNSAASTGPGNVSLTMSVTEKQVLYLWGRPTAGLQLQSMSLNVAASAGVDLVDGAFMINNMIDGSTDRFEHLNDSSSPVVLTSEYTKAQIAMGNSDSLLGWNAFTLFPSSTIRGVGPRCSDGEFGCVMATDGEPAWLLGTLQVEAVMSGVSADIHLQIGDRGMNEVTLADGDYDFNGEVDANDYTVWSDSYGSTTLLAADGNGDGVVDAADYTLWRDHYGDTSVLGTSVDTEVRFGADIGAGIEPLHNASTDRGINAAGDDADVSITILGAPALSTAHSVPEPTAYTLLLLGIFSLLLFQRATASKSHCLKDPARNATINSSTKRVSRMISLARHCFLRFDTFRARNWF